MSETKAAATEKSGDSDTGEAHQAERASSTAGQSAPQAPSQRPSGGRGSADNDDPAGRGAVTPKSLEEARGELEKRYFQVFENMREGFLIQDIVKDEAGRAVDIRYVEVNPAMERFLGKTRAQIIGRTRAQVLGAADPPLVDALHRAVVTRQSTRLVRYSQETGRWYEALSYPFGPDQVATLLLDMTESKQAEQTLVDSERKYRQLVESLQEGIWMIDKDGNTSFVNARMAQMLGYAVEEMLGKPMFAFMSDAGRAHAARYFDRRERGIEEQTDFEFRHKDGSLVYASVESSPLRDASGCYAGALAGVMDVSARKRAEEALRLREKQLAESQRIAHIGSWERNLATGKLDWSDELFRLFGLEPGTPPDIDRLVELVHPDDRTLVRTAREDAIQHGKVHSLEFRFIRNGETRVVHMQAEVLRDETGARLQRGTVQDITERKRAESEIQQREQFIRSMLDSVDEGFIVVDRDYRILTANRAYCDQAGRSADGIIGQHCYEIWGGDVPCYERGEDCAVRRVFETGKVNAAAHLRKDARGNFIHLETKAFPVTAASGEVISAIETVNDITEKHLLQEERLKTQKLESIGRLAGGIAHDFNNLLQAVFGQLSLAKLSAHDPDKVVEMLDQAQVALSLSVNLTTQLLTFAKGGKPVKKRLDLRPVIESAARFALSGSRTGCRLALPDGLWPAEADDGQLAQVIHNIVLNASEAMPDGGTVEVSASNVELAAGSRPAHPDGGKFVRIAITDSGMGIPQSDLSRVFDPYFTTKKKGTGLGLATSYSIVKNHGGSIEVLSERDRGTSFVIYIPALEPEPRDALPRPSTTAQQTREGRILVMDDEAMVRTVAREMLKSLGHDVELAAHGEEAVEKHRQARASGRPFDLLILDLTVRGGMGGQEALRRIKEVEPDVAAVVSSGYSDDPVLSEYRSYGFIGLLSKPYSFDDLKDCLGKIIR